MPAVQMANDPEGAGSLACSGSEGEDPSLLNGPDGKHRPVPVGAERMESRHFGYTDD